MQELELTWNRTMRMWWLLFWRALVGAVILGFVLGFVVGVILAIVGYPQYIILISSIVSYFGGLIWSAFVLRMMLRKKYSDFRLALIPVTLADDYPDVRMPSFR